MKDVLIVTLGTSPEPIINCITSLRPWRVVFLCSIETKNLVETVRGRVPLPDFNEARDVVILQQRLRSGHGEDNCNELDQLDHVYIRSLNLFLVLRQQNPGCRLIADSTGGTKTMTTGLAMAAVDDGSVKLYLTGNDRTKGQAALSGYSAPVAVSTAPIHARRLQDRELPSLLKRHDYEAARQAVRRVQAYSDPDPETLLWLRKLEDLLVALDAWDRFDHLRALEVLTQLGERCLDQKLLFPLKRVIASRRLLDPVAQEQKWPQMKGHGLEAVEDLLLNAERRATQERFDDAVGRLYRAMELTAQLLLKVAVKDQVGPDGIETAAVVLDHLPAAIQPRWREVASRKTNGTQGAPLEIGLTDAFDLLADLGHSTGQCWLRQRNTLINALQIRNHSLFAHGFAPVGYRGWLELSNTLGGFLQVAIEEHTAGAGNSLLMAQFPTTLAELLVRP
jgi:CRISPR-associated protein (TIGR02710 family)